MGSVNALDAMRRHRHSTDDFCWTWLGDREEKFSFCQFFDQAEKYARAYRAAAIPDRGIVLVDGKFSSHALLAFVGALIGGYIPAFIAPLTPKQHYDQFIKVLSNTIDIIQPNALVTDHDITRNISSQAAVRLFSFREIADAASPASDESDPWRAAAPDDIAFLQFSSGTTGMRKGVALTHAMVREQIAQLGRSLSLGRGDVIASWLPLYHDMGLISSFMAPLLLGLPVALQDPHEWVASPQRLFEAIARHRATYCWLPNFAFDHLRLTVPEELQFDLSHVKAFISCSETCKARTVDEFVDRFVGAGVTGATMSSSYAMAEAVFAVTQSPVGAPPARVLALRGPLQTEGRFVPAEGALDGVELFSSGIALPGFQIRCIDTAGNNLPSGRIGEIAIQGPCVIREYFNNEPATRAAISDGWYRTGDLGFIDSGNLYVTGRTKDIIIVNGINYYAHDIENIVSAVPDVKPGRVVAFQIPSETVGSEEVCIAYEPGDPETGENQIHRSIRRSLAGELGLSAVRVWRVPPGWIIKTTSGKVAREENRRKYLAER